MEDRDNEKIIEAEILDEVDRGSARLPVREEPRGAAPAPARPASGWIDALAAIGGGLLRWFFSASRGQTPGGGQGGGQGRGGRMRRRRGKGR